MLLRTKDNSKKEKKRTRVFVTNVRMKSYDSVTIVERVVSMRRLKSFGCVFLFL